MAATDRAARAARALLAAALAATWTPRARATDHATGVVQYYADDDRVRVVSPRASATIERGPATLGARAGVDFVSAASVDLVTAASPRGFEETRVEGGGSGLVKLGEATSVGASVGTSVEPDFSTWTARASASRDVLARLGTVALSYAFGRSTIGRHDDLAFSRARATHELQLSYSHVLRRDAALDVAYDLALVDGFQANPYRFVRLYGPGGGAHATAVPERVPDVRWRHAAVARLRTRLVGALFAVGEYRFYTDTWGMIGHTAKLRATLGWGGDAWTLSLEGRGHVQTAVNFYRERYETFPGVPELRTAEKDLGLLWSVLGGTHLQWSTPLSKGSTLRLGAGADVYHLRYLDYAFLRARTALIGTFDTTLEF